MLLQRLNQLLLVVGLSLTIVGCGAGSDEPQVVPVKGTVTFKGEPIGKINVMFVPMGGNGHIAEGTTDGTGKFQLQTRQPGDGAVVGSYQVSFKFVSDIIPDMPGFVGGVQPEASPIPTKYADETKSGFTANVDADASKNDFKFELKE